MDCFLQVSLVQPSFSFVAATQSLLCLLCDALLNFSDLQIVARLVIHYDMQNNHYIVHLFNVMSTHELWRRLNGWQISQMLRVVSFMATQLPGPNYHCREVTILFTRFSS